jgi:hypothetical protein
VAHGHHRQQQVEVDRGYRAERSRLELIPIRDSHQLRRQRPAREHGIASPNIRDYATLADQVLDNIENPVAGRPGNLVSGDF